MDAARFFASADEEPRATFQANYDAFIERRVHREPMAYIYAGQEFYGRMFEVTPAVLIPRPETEIIVREPRSAWLASREPGARVADIGAGSGCTRDHRCLRAAAVRESAATDVSHRCARDCAAQRQKARGRRQEWRSRRRPAPAARGRQRSAARSHH